MVGSCSRLLLDTLLHRTRIASYKSLTANSQSLNPSKTLPAARRSAHSAYAPRWSPRPTFVQARPPLPAPPPPPPPRPRPENSVSLGKNNLLRPAQQSGFIPKPPTSHPTNYDINTPLVRLVDAETNRLGEPQALSSLLDHTNLRTHFVELVSRIPPNGNDTHGTTIGIVRIKCLKDERQRQREVKVKTKAREQQAKTKELVITWGISSADLEHKMRKLRSYLERLYLVDVQLQPKSSSPRYRHALPKRREMYERMDYIFDFVKDVAVERRKRRLERVSGALFMRGVAPGAASTETPAEDDAD